MKIPLSQPDITEAEIEAVTAVLRSSRLSLGPKMEEFEHLVSACIGVPHAIAVSSGTAGLHLCMVALGIGPGDEVIVPSFTFIAAANAVRYVGATPVFVDIEQKTLNLDPARIEEAITPRTRAILVVHTFGCPADMDAISEIARRNHLLLIEDACEAIGAEYREKKAGSFGNAAVFAFYPNKQITTGEGGIVVTSDATLARNMRALRNHGRYESDEWLQHSLFGYNYRLPEMSCALGCVQMQRLDSILKMREDAAQTYDAILSSCHHVLRPPVSLENRRISWFVYVVRILNGNRNQAIQQMAAHGIACGRYFAPIHQQPAYYGYTQLHPLEITETISKQTLALPFFNKITTAQIEYVCDRLFASIA